MSGVPEFSRGNAPDPLAYTPARAALLDRLDLPVSQSGFPWDRARVLQVRFVTASASLQTVVSVAGRGYAKFGVVSADTITNQARAVITVDGFVVDDFAAADLALSNNVGCHVYGGGNIVTFPLVGSYGRINLVTGNSDFNYLSDSIFGFRSSLLIQVSTTSGSGIIGFAVVTTV